jgi:hypothetical protein
MDFEVLKRVLAACEGRGVAFHIDILTRLGDAFKFSDLEIQRLPYQDLTVNVITPRMLYKMKKDTVRPQDHVDADLVRRRFDLDSD